MKTPMDDAVRVLADLANEGFSRGWDRLDRADKVEEIGEAIGGIHAEWMVLQDKLAAYECVVEAAKAWRAAQRAFGDLDADDIANSEDQRRYHAAHRAYHDSFDALRSAIDALGGKDASK
jgi:hypothetical protein